MTAHSKRLKAVGAGVLASLLAASPAAASSVSISISARARTICKVEVGAVAVPEFQPGETDLGHMTELCNNVEGYRLVLSHPAGLVDAWAVVDGVRIPLSSTTTQTVIVDSDAPAFRERDLGIILSSAEPNLGLSLRAEAKGMIF
jgi:hypothetical protein